MMKIIKAYFCKKTKTLNRVMWFLLGLSVGIGWLPLSVLFLVIAVVCDFLAVALSVSNVPANATNVAPSDKL